MVRINLLPHRELKRKRQRDAFFALAAINLLIGSAVVFAVYGVIGGRIEQQQGRNSYLVGEIAILDKQIEEIRKLREQTQAMLARKKVVETLQGNRSEAVHLLDQLVRQLPDGVYLKSVKQNGSTVNITGYAQSNARVSSLLRNLEASPWLEQPSLVEIKAAASTAATTRLNEFSVNVRLTRAAAEGLDSGKKTAAGHKDKQS
ncbi:MAG: PilN domain-containing protein [Burkholderiales bacterium]